MSTSGAGRHPRVNPRSELHYKSWTIPIGVSPRTLSPTLSQGLPTKQTYHADASKPNPKIHPREPLDLPLPPHILARALG